MGVRYPRTKPLYVAKVKLATFADVNLLLLVTFHAGDTDFGPDCMKVIDKAVK
jgi:hypothetical protein